MTLAPLVVKDKVIIGVAGGDRGIRGFIAAYDARTGKEAWRFRPSGPGEPGHETWEASVLITTSPSYCDGGVEARWRVHLGYRVIRSALNLTYWGIGNLGPD